MEQHRQHQINPEAKEILSEHYDNIEQRVEDIEAEIEALQKNAKRLSINIQN